MEKQIALDYLAEAEVLTQAQHEQAVLQVNAQPTQVNWEIRTLFGAGSALLTTGLGVLVYKNIDSLGHQVIVALLVLSIAGCAAYVFAKRQPYTHNALTHTNTAADYSLLLGCTLFLVLEGYLQYQYHIFGRHFSKMGLATLIPMVLFFTLAYRFDHLGVLTMAITALVSWVGVNMGLGEIIMRGIDPFQAHSPLVVTAMVLGVALMAAGEGLALKKIKAHFAATYVFYGLCLACMAALERAFDNRFYCVLVLALSALAIAFARRRHSHLSLVAGVVFAYVAFSILVSKVNYLIGPVYYGFFSCGGVVVFFLYYKKILGMKDDDT